MHLFLLLSIKIFNKVMGELVIENKDLTHNINVSLYQICSVCHHHQHQKIWLFVRFKPMICLAVCEIQTQATKECELRLLNLFYEFVEFVL